MRAMLPAIFQKILGVFLAAAAVLSSFFGSLFKQPPPEAARPVVTGTFMQGWAFKSFDAGAIGRHFDYLLEAGIDTVILQTTASTPYGRFEYAYYPSALAAQNPADSYDASGEALVENCLANAEQRGMKVFLGLNCSDEWWSEFVKGKPWYTMQANLGNGIAEELYGLYKEKYPNAFYGWYFVWEFSNSLFPYETRCADMLNINLDYLTELDPSMPLMLSPFLNAGISPVQTRASWSAVFAMTRLREGDIFCCQDSVGAGFIKLEQLDRYYSAVKDAVDTKPGLRFWANNENFTQADWSSAPLSRFVTQMKIASKYVENHVTFAYSHYYSPDMGKQAYHDAYKQYVLTGEITDPDK